MNQIVVKYEGYCEKCAAIVSFEGLYVHGMAVICKNCQMIKQIYLFNPNEYKISTFHFPGDHLQGKSLFKGNKRIATYLIQMRESVSNKGGFPNKKIIEFTFGRRLHVDDPMAEMFLDGEEQLFDAIMKKVREQDYSKQHGFKLLTDQEMEEVLMEIYKREYEKKSN